MDKGPISSRGPLIDWTAYGRMHADRGEVWQIRLEGAEALLDGGRFTQMARMRGSDVGGGLRDGAERLWALGWMKADLVRVATEVDESDLLEVAGDGLVALGEDDYGRRLYADARAAGHGVGANRVGGLAGAGYLEGIQPLFHPFRYHVYHWIEGMLRFNVTPLSTLTTAGIESLNGLYERVAGWKDERFGSASFSADLREFNERATLAALVEPLYFGRMFGFRTRRTQYDPDELGISEDEYKELADDEARNLGLDLFDRLVHQHQDDVFPLLRQVGQQRLEYERRRLCDAVSMLEANSDVLTLLRMSRWSDRLALGGATGGAMLTLTMAEALRRATEEALEIELPEEDELYPNVLSPEVRADSKRRAYGTHRLLDDEEAMRDYVKMQGLDTAARVRWYVEGETERGALSEVFERRGDRRVALVNLRAQFGQRRGRIDASGFRERLRQDLSEGVFSLVSVDGDDEGVCRIVRSAIEDGDLFGEAFVSKPDFEIGNFEPAELADVLWKWIREVEEGRRGEERDESALQEDDKALLLSAVEGAENNGQFFDRAYDALKEQSAGFDKSEEWGRRLMAYATEQPETGTGDRRPLIEAVDRAYDLAQANYSAVRTNKRTDTETWALVPRD
jgi:hypothetical protein